jgi:hypothetical protein
MVDVAVRFRLNISTGARLVIQPGFWALAFLNGCLLYCTATGANESFVEISRGQAPGATVPDPDPVRLGGAAALDDTATPDREEGMAGGWDRPIRTTVAMIEFRSRGNETRSLS